MTTYNFELTATQEKALSTICVEVPSFVQNCINALIIGRADAEIEIICEAYKVYALANNKSVPSNKEAIVNAAFADKVVISGVEQTAIRNAANALMNQ